jgi:hypothetical protein
VLAAPWLPGETIDRSRDPAETGIVRKGSRLTVHITIEDYDDRPERMVRDPDRYFADARERAEMEVRHQARWLFPLRRHRKRR